MMASHKYQAYKKYGIILFLITCATMPGWVSANQLQNENSFLSALKQGHTVITLGAYQAAQGTNQHINISDLIGDTFSVSNHHDTNVLLGLGYFIEGKNWHRFEMSYGLNVFYLAPTSVSGDVTQENMFTNLSYHYRVRHVPLYAMAQSTMYFKSSAYALVFDAGLGPNWMKVEDFHENSLDGGVTVPDQIFSSNNKTTLSATLGIGVKINQALGQLAAECAYRFFYLGQGEFNISNTQVLNRLKTGEIYANALVCSISI